jgi:hypothetical protein
MWKEAAESYFEVTHEYGTRGMHVGYWWESQKERDHKEDQKIGGWIILKWIFERYYWMVWTGWFCLRIATTGGLL